MNVREVKLDPLAIAVERAVSKRELTGQARASLKVETIENVLADALVVQLRTYIHSCKIATYDAYFETPANWWQHLRSQLGLSHRTKTRVCRIDRYRTYPSSDVVLPREKFGSPMLVEMVSVERPS